MTITIQGLGDVQAAIKRLPPSLRRLVLDEAAQAGAAFLKRQARQAAPVGDTRVLKRQIRVRKPRIQKNKKTTATWQVGSFARHSYLVEFGNTKTSPRRHKGTGKSTGDMPSNPFMRRTFQRHARGAIRQGQLSLRRTVERAIRAAKR